MQSPLWHADDRLVRLQTSRLSAAVDRLNPARGLHDLRIDQQPLDRLELLQVDLQPVDDEAPAGAIESFVRGGDLAVTYDQRPQSGMRTQVYWRAAAHKLAGAIAAVELVVSVQTDLLDSCPRIPTGSRLRAERAFRQDDPPRGPFVEIPSQPATGESDVPTERPCAHLFHLPCESLSYAEMVHPVDGRAARLEFSSDGASRLRHELFTHRLEKGVILRARVLGLWLARADDQRAAAQHFAAFLGEELPLTT